MPGIPATHRPRPRKSPRQARSAATVAAIVEAAARILEQRGHDGFSTNAVAERAGVSIGSLYQYFPDKDALIGALILREAGSMAADARAACSEATGKAMLSALIGACVAHQLRRPFLARLLDFEEARLPLDADVKAVKEKILVTIRDALKRPDLPRQPDPISAANDVLAIIKGVVDAAGERGESDAEHLAGRVGRAVFGYVGVAPER